VTVSATPTRAVAKLDVRVLNQDLVPGVALDQLAQLEAQADFDAPGQRVQITLTRALLCSGAADARALPRTSTWRVCCGSRQPGSCLCAWSAVSCACAPRS
jgi:hypothetical protein